MFNHDPEEVQLWLNALPQNFSTANGLAMSDTQRAVLQFLDNCIGRFSKAQYKYTDELVSLVNTVNAEVTSKSESTLVRTLIAADSNTGASDYKHPFSPLLLTLFENLNFIKADRRPAVLYLTNLITLLLTKQSIPFYLQKVCSKLDNEVDNDTPVNAYDVSEWTKNEMIHQARLCLGRETATAISKEFTHVELEEEFTTLIKSTLVDNVAESKEKFITLLEKLPVSVLDLHLEKAAAFCCHQLQWTLYEPLVDYITLRHPLAGSIFSYTDVVHMRSLISMEQ